MNNYLNLKNNQNIKNIRINRIFNKMQITAFLLTLLVIFPVQLNNIFAVDFSSLYGNYTILSYPNSSTYISYQGRNQTLFEYYSLNSNQEKIPAYCMTLGLNGAETTNNGYIVNCIDLLQNEAVSNIILSGYPYKTPSELSLKSENEAWYATQFAIWIKLNNLDISQITPINDEYTRITDAITNIYNNSIYYNKKQNITPNINELADTQILDNNTNYYEKVFKLEYDDNINKIELNLTGINDYIITDLNNNKIDDLLGHHKIKIIFPRNTNIKSNICNLNVDLFYKEDVILSAKSTINNMQDMALASNILTKYSINTSFNFTPIETKLKILKKDSKSANVYIPNTKFNIYDKNNNLINFAVTDKSGTITLNVENDLHIFDNSVLYIKEIYVPSPYTIDKNNDTQKIQLKLGEINTVTFENEKKEISKIVPSKITVLKQPKIELPKTGY